MKDKKINNGQKSQNRKKETERYKRTWERVELKIEEIKENEFRKENEKD